MIVRVDNYVFSVCHSHDQSELHFHTPGDYADDQRIKGLILIGLEIAQNCNGLTKLILQSRKAYYSPVETVLPFSHDFSSNFDDRIRCHFNKILKWIRDYS